jgi:DNA-binding HxlR family transcriptional regulator
MKRQSLETEECPVARSLDVVGDWWSLLIVRDAFAGLRRFGEFQQSLGIARNILTTRLRKLVDRGVLETVPASDGSAYREYVLTADGRRLFPVLVALMEWGETCTVGPKKSGTVLVERRTGKPVRLELRAKDGRILAPDDVEFVAAPGR